MLAEATANRILIGFGGKHSDEDFVWPYHYYPDLFENQSEEMEEQRELAETERFKAQMARRVDAWNARFEGENENDG